VIGDSETLKVPLEERKTALGIREEKGEDIGGHEPSKGEEFGEEALCLFAGFCY
jgi:hypothetical protein